MAELIGQSITKHLDSILSEFKSHNSIYGYPKRKMYMGFDGYDLGVNFHGQRAETVLGPASGPHTQMIQNIILTFLGGSRIIELKTVQILDRLEISRPCIDIRNVGYNIEWSQELSLKESYREYVTAWVLLKIIEASEILGKPKGSPFYDTVFDVSVGYDLKGIQSLQVSNWLRKIKNAEGEIKQLLSSLPEKYRIFRNLKINPNIANSITLSTFHGCPANEIEAMVEYLIAELGFHVIVKMNPTILGYQAVENILHNKLGYNKIELDPAAFDHDISFNEAVSMMKRLEAFAQNHKKNLGAKFTNTLVVKNNRDIFKDDEVQYLSGAPLHVLAMNGMHMFREKMGQSFPISFSAGVTKQNFVDTVLCNIKPVTTCTDLLKEGGYSRLFQYLKRLKEAMETKNCSNMNAFLKAGSEEESLADAGFAFAAQYIGTLVSNPFYQQEKNQKEPPKIDSHLKLFDCITCDKCLPVCPNAANFSIDTGAVRWPKLSITLIHGKFKTKADGIFQLQKKAQIANLADFCNDCGDCDTYCPESGGPYIEKPRFFFSEESYKRFSEYDGFYLPAKTSIKGRIAGNEFSLVFNSTKNRYIWENGNVKIQFDAENNFLNGKVLINNLNDGKIEIESFYIMRVLFEGLKTSRHNYTSIMLGVH